MDDDLSFLEEDDNLTSPDNFWNILVVDDDKDVHATTRFAFAGVQILGKRLNLIDAFSGEEAREIITNRTDIDLMLLDAVMETETAGLDCAKYIKKELGRNIPIIIMRSGFAGWEIEYNTHKIDVLDDFLMKTEVSNSILKKKVEFWLMRLK